MDEFKKLALLFVVLMLIGAVIALVKRPPEPNITFNESIPVSSPTRPASPEPILISDLPPSSAPTQGSDTSPLGSLFSNLFSGSAIKAPTFNTSNTPTSLSEPPLYTEPLTEEELQEELEKAEKQAEEIQEKINELEEAEKQSPYYNLITISRGGATSDSYQSEYLTLQVSSKLDETISISGLRLYSEITGSQATLTQVMDVPIPGSGSNLSPLYVSGGEKIIVNTGISPLGESFRLNICSGYLTQSQSFSPSIPLSCPDPEDGMDLKTVNNPNGFTEQCIDYVASIGRCKSPSTPLPLTLSEGCKEFILEKTNYTGCLANYRSSPDFYKNEWRVYIGRKSELWANRDDLIVLYDSNGKVVDTLSY